MGRVEGLRAPWVGLGGPKGLDLGGGGERMGLISPLLCRSLSTMLSWRDAGATGMSITGEEEEGGRRSPAAPPHFPLLLPWRCHSAHLCAFLQDGSLRGGGGWQAGLRGWGLRAEPQPARSCCSGRRVSGSFQANQSAASPDYGSVQPHPCPAELLHRQQIIVPLWGR